MAYDNSNSGFLAPSEKTKEKSPDGTGKITTRCPHCDKDTEFRVAGWTNVSPKFVQDWNKTGRYVSLKLSLPDPGKQRTTAPLPNDFDDHLPF